MNEKPFYLLHGNNGATYIFNTRSIRDCIESVQFYKALTLKAKIQKTILCLFLIIAGKLKLSVLKTAHEVEQYIYSISHTLVRITVPNNASLHIAPTRDKIIINTHRLHFQKIAFGGSYANVKHEAQVYSLFTREPKHFQVSEFSDFVDVENMWCSFVLKNEKTKKQIAPSQINMAAILAEFFTYGANQPILLKDYIQTEIFSKNIPEQWLIDILNRIIAEHGNQTIRQGLSHRDFKPWNVKYLDKLLIFDFEEATTTGMPLEDMLNYIVDPIIRYENLQNVKNILYNHENINIYIAYLQQLHISIDFKIFIQLYATNRYLFWKKTENNRQIAILFSDLLKIVE